MHIMPNGPTAYCDVDDTLISWIRPGENTPEEDKVTVTTRDISDTFVINHHNVEYIKKLAVRGHCVIIWSAGGSCWARAVAEALGLEKYIWAVMSKPTYFIDDIKDPKEFMGKHVFYDMMGNRTGYSPNKPEEDK